MVVPSFGQYFLAAGGPFPFFYNSQNRSCPILSRSLRKGGIRLTILTLFGSPGKCQGTTLALSPKRAKASKGADNAEPLAFSRYSPAFLGLCPYRVFDSIRLMLFTSSALILFSSMVLPIGAQSVSPQTASPAVLIHQRVNQSCELVQPAAVKDNGKYASLVVPGTAAEIYSSELAKDDFLSYSKEVPGNLVKLARKSGFDVKPGGSNADSPRVVNLNGNGQCPNLEEALQTAEMQRRDRRVQVQTRLYQVTSDNVTPPSSIHTPAPAPEQKATGVSPTGTNEKVVEGVVILNIVVDREGKVSKVKVVRSLTPDMDKEAVERVKTWKFDPSRKDGMPVAVEMNIEVAIHRN
jgi:TonB family protein